jgi:hypothetical protein
LSFDPPPRPEFTIISPSSSATRVRPPGTIEMSSPKTANGRRSTCRGDIVPSGPTVGTVESFTTSWAIHFSGCARMTSARAASSSRGVSGPMTHALAARLAGRLDHELVEAGQHVLALGVVGQQVRVRVLQQRLLVEVEADHVRHAVADRLVVGDAGADGVGDRDGALAVGADEPGHAERGVGAELERVDEVVVQAPVHRVDALQTVRRAHVEDVVAHDEVARLHELDAHLRARNACSK